MTTRAASTAADKGTAASGEQPTPVVTPTPEIPAPVISAAPGAPTAAATAADGELETLRARIAEFERKEMTESQRLARDLATAQAEIAKRDAKDADARRNEAITARAGELGALYPKTIPALLASKGLELDKAGNPKDLEVAIAALRKELPALFRPAGSADGGAGNGAAAPTEGAVNAYIRSRIHSK